MHGPTSRPLLECIGLGRQYVTGGGLLGGPRRVVHAVDGIDLRVYPGETLGLVGESGCGKSTLARCVVRLDQPTSGNLRFEDRDITRLSMREMRPLRARLQMVFQDPAASLNPRRRIGDLLAEPLRVQGVDDRQVIRARLEELLALVGLDSRHLLRFPHEFSGGQRQRIGIARALVLSPALVIADEPVSALDVSIQAQIINLMTDLQERLGLTYLFIAHDLSVIRQVSSRTAVMYLGSIVETGPTDGLFRQPAHPYSRALISAVPVADPQGRRTREILAGDPPSPLAPPSGCRFHPRCAQAQARCRVERPILQPLFDGRSVACHFPLI